MKTNENNSKTSWYKTLYAKILKHKWRWTFAGILVVIILFSVLKPKTEATKNYVTMDISKGNISYTVTATGEIMPVNTVNIGSQVSGTIQEIFVDYNSVVKQGDILLKIDPSVLQSSVDEAQASLTSAKSQYTYAKNEYLRNKSLYKEGYISRAEMEQSQTTYEQAEQNVKKQQYSYDRAVTNLGYATITSPVNGTVISRKVDKGQTVAASFQTPDLFEIAEDLTKMQIETSVSEADIGAIKEGQPVTFTVDAYTNDTFAGSVKQVRLSPTTTSNVVVYTVVIDVDNADLRLMPGMTAFVTIIVAEAKDTFKVQNAALLTRSFETIAENIPNDVTPNTHLAIKRGDDIIFVKYEKGLESATETQIISDDIQPGDKIVVGRAGQRSNKNSSKSGMSPHGAGGPMGGPM